MRFFSESNIFEIILYFVTVMLAETYKEKGKKHNKNKNHTEKEKKKTLMKV